MPVEFGATDPRDLPVVPMAYVLRAVACGHIREVVSDDGTATAARAAADALWRYPIPAGLERIPLADARREVCPACDVPPPLGLGL